MTTNGGYTPLTKEEQFENMRNFCSYLYKENEALKKIIKDNLPDLKNKVENMNKNDLSEAELKLVKYFDFEDIIETSIQPIDLYRLMVDKSFRYNDTTVYSSALRKAWNEIYDFKKFRKTPEFDKIILDELNGAESDCTIEEENYSPYCELCGGCGEDGCCSHLSCFRTLIENPKCEYGKTYLSDAQFADELYKLGFEIKEKLKNKEITADDAVIEYENNYDLIWKKVYGKD